MRSFKFEKGESRHIASTAKGLFFVNIKAVDAPIDLPHIAILK